MSIHNINNPKQRLLPEGVQAGKTKSKSPQKTKNIFFKKISKTAKSGWGKIRKLAGRVSKGLASRSAKKTVSYKPLVDEEPEAPDSGNVNPYVPHKNKGPPPPIPPFDWSKFKESTPKSSPPKAPPFDWSKSKEPPSKQVIQKYIKEEIHANTTPGTLLRSDFKHGAMIKFVESHAAEFISMSLKPTMENAINRKKTSLEVNPIFLQKSISKKGLKKRQKKLLRAVSQYLEDVHQAADQLDNETKTLLKFIYDEVKNKEYSNIDNSPEEKVKRAKQQVAAQIFLRTLNPRLITSIKDPKVQRELILITKITQNAANQVEFNEEYMRFANASLEKFQDKIDKIIQAAITT